MNARWLVHCGDEALGPWSAEQVREELRAGRIDAFDLVALEGSAKKRPLIDVDEIFISVGNKKASVKNQSESQDKTVLLAVGTGGTNNPTGSSEAPPIADQAPHQGAKKTPSFTKPRAFEALAAPLAVQKPAIKNDGQRIGPAAANPPTAGVGAGTVRRYVLWTSEQSPQGPFTSREVLTFWYAKKLPPNTIVQRAGQSKRVNIEEFARFYEKAAPSGIAFVGEAQAAAGRLDASTRGLVFAVLAGFSIVAAALVWSYSPKVVLEGVNRIYRSVVGGFQSDHLTDAPLDQSRSDDRPLSEQKTGKGHLTDRSQVPQSKVKPKVSSGQTRRPQKAGPKVERSARSARRPTPPPAPVRPILSQVPTSRSVANSGLIEGATVTLTGYRFNISALNACDLKCKIPMSGPKGPIIAVFFKEAFAGALSKNASSVSLTGTIRRDTATGSLSILVQSVK
jgi:hypothetical protein